MKKNLLLSCLIIFLASCEDTKKASVKMQPKEKVEALDKKKNGDSILISSKEKGKPKEKKYPKITQENVVEFLTEYGKNNPETKVRISTIHGNIDIQLYKDTPLHRANFVYLVKQNYFDATFFHRVDPNFIIQGGNSDDRSTFLKRRELSEKYRLPAELNSGRIHQYGTISGAKEYRKNPDKMTAPYEFFIFIGPKRSADHLNRAESYFNIQDFEQVIIVPSSFKSFTLNALLFSFLIFHQV